MEIEKIIEKYNDGSYAEIYHKKGDQDYLHREDGPAWIVYNEDGSIQYESYYINDKLHREDGPALIRYCENGSIDYEQYWINDRSLYKEEWEEKYGWKSKLKGTPMESIYK